MMSVWDVKYQFFIRALIMSKNRVIIIPTGNYCKVRSSIIGLFGANHIYVRRQLGARTRGIGQNIIKEIFVILRHIV